MRLLKNKLLIKLALFVLAFQVVNMSIDVPVAQMKNSATKGDFNFIDTYIEFVTEVIFKYENAIPESRHRHHRELQAHQQVQVICQQIQIAEPSLAAPSPSKGYPVYINNYAFQFVQEFNRPPSST